LSLIIPNDKSKTLKLVLSGLIISRIHPNNRYRSGFHRTRTDSVVETKIASVAHSSHYQGPSALPENAAAHSLRVGATAITNKSKRPSKIELAATLRKIRLLLAEGYTNREIIEMLQIEERTFYR
jgi:DNA-binding NarL/FixJ family response regulator